MRDDATSPGASLVLAPGVVLDGKYEILARLGAGGMGEVFKVLHVHLNAFRCVKVMRASLMSDESYRSRFLREARLATQIHHPNVAVVHDFSSLADGSSYMVTEFIDGITVRQWAATYGRFPLPLAAEVAVQVLGGLAHIHKRGLLHRDISADNIMLSFDSDDHLLVKIIDLGIAKDVSATNSDTTQMGLIVGNPKYMSPEQLGDLREGEQLDGRSDIYGLGVVLYEMLLGVPPFVSKTPHGYILKHLTERPRSFIEANSNLLLPTELESVVFRALAKDRRERYADAREFAEALKRFVLDGNNDLTRSDLEVMQSSGEQGPTPASLDDTPTHELQLPTSDPRELDWQKTLAANTVDSYREYIERHPTGIYVDAAHERLAEFPLFEEIRLCEATGDREEIARLAEMHDSSSRVGVEAREALGRMGSIEDGEAHSRSDFESAWESGTAEAWRGFLAFHPRSPLNELAEIRLRECEEFDAARQDGSAAALSAFLAEWREGRHHYDAEILLSAAKQTQRERELEAAIASDTSVALRRFASKYPNSPRIAEVRQRLEERLAFEMAFAMDTEESWGSYLSNWESDPHAVLARERLEAARAIEEAEFARANEDNSSAAWDAFLNRYPQGRRNARAQQRRREALAFEQARESDRTALERFVHEFPDSSHAREARRIVRRLSESEDFARAEENDSPHSWQEYLSLHPAGTHAEAARERLHQLEDDVYARVIELRDPVAASEFLSTFPESPRCTELGRILTSWEESAAVRAALEAISAEDVHGARSWIERIFDDDKRAEITQSLEVLCDRLTWAEAQRAGSAGAMRRYLDNFPEGRWIRQATEALNTLVSRQQESEPHDWDIAWEAGSTKAWDVYLAEHADSERASEARRCREEAIEFEAAQKLDTPVLWRAFLKTWPEGRHRLEAELRLERAAPPPARGKARPQIQ